MKHQLKFLIGGFSLLALVLCHANPAEAQETEFTVTIFSIAFEVLPNGVSLGNVAAAGTAQSDSTQCTGDGTTGFNCTGDISTRPITIKNKGTAAIGVFAQQKNPAIRRVFHVLRIRLIQTAFKLRRLSQTSRPNPERNSHAAAGSGTVVIDIPSNSHSTAPTPGNKSKGTLSIR